MFDRNVISGPPKPSGRNRKILREIVTRGITETPTNLKVARRVGSRVLTSTVWSRESVDLFECLRVRPKASVVVDPLKSLAEVEGEVSCSNQGLLSSPFRIFRRSDIMAQSLRLGVHDRPPAASTDCVQMGEWRDSILETGPQDAIVSVFHAFHRVSCWAISSSILLARSVSPPWRWRPA